MAKLVRDKIPEIIKNNNDGYVNYYEEDYIVNQKELLRKKIVEEVDELLKAIDKDDNIDILEESADVVEVIRAILLIRGISFEDLQVARFEKNRLKGSFSKFCVLK